MKNCCFSTNQAAHYLGISPSTIRRWADEEKISSTRTQGGHRRFCSEELDKFRTGEEVELVAHCVRVGTWIREFNERMSFFNPDDIVTVNIRQTVGYPSITMFAFTEGNCRFTSCGIPFEHGLILEDR